MKVYIIAGVLILFALGFSCKSEFNESVDNYWKNYPESAEESAKRTAGYIEHLDKERTKEQFKVGHKSFEKRNGN